jgi:hypothetical protein
MTIDKMIIFCQDDTLIMVMKIDLYKPTNIKENNEKIGCFYVTNFTIF